MRRLFTIIIAMLFAGPLFAQTDVQESPYWADKVAAGEMPAATDRIPSDPLIVNLADKGRDFGTQGGTLHTMVTRAKDIRQMVPFGYARLVGYDQDYVLAPDILADYNVKEGRKFTLHLRKGHRWSDGAPFTSDDFKYWWVNVANNPDLSPSGPPEFLRVDGEMPQVSFPDPQTIIYEWSRPNTHFIPTLAQARPPFIFRPAHYLKQFHADFTPPEAMEDKIETMRVRSWAAMHNKLDNMYKFDNPDLPTLQPWMRVGGNANSRFMFVRNPYYHRIDSQGTQLPYIDEVEMTVVGRGLVAAKSNAGESSLQARGLGFRDISILKKGELENGNYRVFLWANGTASQIAIYPNLNYADPEWRKILRDVRFRRALSLGIDRRMINRALYFGIAKEGGMTVLPQSPFYNGAYRAAWAQFDIQQANALLDDMGLTDRTPAGYRKLPDGRTLAIIVETAGERQEVENALQIITDTWRDIGVRLIMRPFSRDTLRNRVYSGASMASVWYGWDNGIPTLDTSPDYLAPRAQEFFAWPMWGQYFQTDGQAGEAPDMPEAIRLLQLSKDWEQAENRSERRVIWDEMLAIHADQHYGIGLLSEAPQPVVVSRRLRNVPEVAFWAWEPGAQFGIHRPDEFFFTTEGGE
ncbi:ABC transporter substrate-binding protein [Profundibacter amoris]|uniref:ABC transporter substrate-binding protein n=1 Tax=Profundibacter amoris TaxID=2171755 RepID=A0A347UJL1_9RHOB|nr:ABC transporter substrate-binding protein [Profundibacter amoris]AXX99039.1 ABC transporter substrate-binding protein [Profundibacter amoris]